MFQRVFAFLFLISLTAPAHAILGGQAFSLDKPVARVTVAISDLELKAFCSGFLISQNAVVTAAHCVKGKSPRSLFITFGTNALLSSVYRGVSRVYIPREYVAYGGRLPHVTDAYDIAVVMFEGLLPPPYRPARLAQGNALRTGDGVEIAGFGFNQREATGAGILRGCLTEMQNPNYSQSEFKLAASDRCSPSGRDSGGPVFRVQGETVTVHGIHIWGWHNDLSAPTYGIHTKIGFYYPWIQAILINPINR